MNDRIVVIISSPDPGTARTGAMYAVNALKHGWMEEVKLFFFGPAEDLLLQDAEMQSWLREYQALEETAVACKFIADRDGTADGIAGLDVQVEYVGSMISDLIKEGYVPMVW
jgi:hypothetical protein